MVLRHVEKCRSLDADRWGNRRSDSAAADRRSEIAPFVCIHYAGRRAWAAIRLYRLVAGVGLARIRACLLLLSVSVRGSGTGCRMGRIRGDFPTFGKGQANCGTETESRFDLDGAAGRLFTIHAERGLN